MAGSSYHRLYLSPHLDDVVFSCGGLIRKQTLAGERVLVVTLFAGIPSYEHLSPFARFLHLTAGNPPDPVGLRRLEDQAAIRSLGGDFLHLEFLDAIYRQDEGLLYESERALFGPLHPKDEPLKRELLPLLERIAKQFGTPPIYAPLAVGHHVDHQIVRRAADSLRRRGYPVIYYEDFPYVEEEAALLLALGDGEQWSPTLEGIADTIEEKIEAIAFYASQTFHLFRRKEMMERRVRACAASLAPERGPCERYWKPAQAMI